MSSVCISQSVNLQYNALGRLDDGTNESSTKRLMFQVLLFFHDFLQNSLQKSYQFFFIFWKITKITIKSFECPMSIKSIKKIIHGTSDSWSTNFLSHRPSNPAYYIVNWRIFIVAAMIVMINHCKRRIDCEI